MKPRLLDLFCGAGGAAVGYHRAGFDVVGVDLHPQPNYPFEFHQADALDFPLDGYDAIHASPPCQDHSMLSSLVGKHGTGWMLRDVIDRLRAVAALWAVENVGTARMPPDVNVIRLCGGNFGLRVRRHRLFATSFPLLGPGCHHRRDDRPPIGVYGHGSSGNRRRERNYGYKGTVSERRAAMGIDWMTRDELSQAIPPAYTQWIGEQLLQHLEPAA